MAARQIFYGLTYVEDFKKTGKKLPYMIHTLTDETYALLNSITEYPKDMKKENIQFYGSSNIEMGKKWYENIIFSFIYAIISMKVIY